ncbi:zinc ribbon domain-containing protein [Streptomyces sp. NPDC002076]
MRTQRARNQGRQERAGKQGARPYALRGRVRCSLCGRKMQPATIRSRVYYRCEFIEEEAAQEEAALYPDLTHPRTVYLREDIVCQALDRSIARAFAPDRLSATIEALTHASAAASTAEPQTPEQTQARQAIKDCERRLARYQAALDAGADPAVVTQWINEAQRDNDAAQKKLDAHPAVTRKKQPPLDAQQIRRITESLGDIAQRIQTAAVEKKGPLYDALGITISYEHATRTATVRSRPSSPYRQALCPRGEFTADDTVVVAQGRLGLRNWT